MSVTNDQYERVFERAVEVLGTKERAESWLEKMSDTLECHPQELLETENGVKQLMLHLHDVEIALSTDS
ncbi:MAG: hypothetical protein ACPGO3_02150 [Magnetospiraceae bacterium]